MCTGAARQARDRDSTRGCGYTTSGRDAVSDCSPLCRQDWRSLRYSIADGDATSGVDGKPYADGYVGANGHSHVCTADRYAHRIADKDADADANRRGYGDPHRYAYGDSCIDTNTYAAGGGHPYTHADTHDASSGTEARGARSVRGSDDSV